MPKKNVIYISHKIHVVHVCKFQAKQKYQFCLAHHLLSVAMGEQKSPVQIQKFVLILLAACDAKQQTWERIVFGILRPVCELCPCLRLVWANMMPTGWFEPFWYCAGPFIKPVAACLIFLIHSLIVNKFCLLCSWAYVSCHPCNSTATAQTEVRSKRTPFLKMGKWLRHFPQPRFQAVGLAIRA